MKNRLYQKTVLIVLVILSLLFSSGNTRVFAKEMEKKAFILIVDEVSLDDLVDSQAANINYLIDQGATGFMNTRAKSAISNRGSSYLSLGMGVRTLASTQGGQAFNRGEEIQPTDYLPPGDVPSQELYKLYSGQEGQGEVLNIAIEDIRRTALDITPNNQVGALGQLAKENDLRIGLVGNADFNSLNRESTMLAMDSQGLIPLGSVSSQLLLKDPSVLGGLRLDQAKLLEEVDRILPQSDLVFIDYGDTVRVSRSDRLASDSVRREERFKAIRRADEFLGQLMERVNMDESLFMVISPNPSKEMIAQGNFGLTPVILYKDGIGQGLLTSNLTRRDGLVTNFDFSASILDYFNITNSQDLSGEAMGVQSSDEPVKDLREMEASFLYIRKYRNAFHWVFIGLGLLGLLGLYLPTILKKKGLNPRFLAQLVLTCLSLPLAMLLIPLVGYRSIVMDLSLVVLASLVFSSLVYKLSQEDFLNSLGLLAGLTSIFILIDGYFFNRFMIISPLGSDAIAGGRFYGIGNDYMGLLIGSSLTFLFTSFRRLKLGKPTMFGLVLLYMGLVVLALSPLFGANMGGSISGLAVILFAFFLIFDKKLSLKKLGIIGLAVLVFILGVAGLDALLNPSPTHAGKAILALGSGGYNKLFEIIRIKLGQVFYNLAHSSWNIVLFAELGLVAYLLKFKREELGLLREKYPLMLKAYSLILIDALVIFMFNDTGTIAAALIMLYSLLPLGVLYRQEDL